MKTLRRVTYAGFAAAAFAIASMPAMSGTAWPDVDFEWYANVGKPFAGTVVAQAYPAPRAGYIWSPAHYVGLGPRQVLVDGHWVIDDYARQVAIHSARSTTVATGPMVLRDRDGYVIPTDPAAYPVESARR
ncbi:MAG: hypothetical protein ACXWAC_01335 [Usitatibacter sp.]